MYYILLILRHIRDSNNFEHEYTEICSQNQYPSQSDYRRTTMKLYLSLSIFAAVITGMPSVSAQRWIDPESIERSVVSERQYGRRGIDVERKAESRRVMGTTPICSAATCGRPTTAECASILKRAGTSFTPSDRQYCSQDLDVLGFGLGGPCQIGFCGHKPNNESTCISARQWAELVDDILNSCVNNPEVRVGGCIDLEDSGRVCVGDNEPSNACF